MKGRLHLVIAATLVGCATLSPTDLRQQGTAAEAGSSKEPLEAATCMVRKVESMTFGINMKAIVQLRPAPAQGSYEVIVYGDPGAHGALALAEVTPATSGSRIVMWRNEESPLIGAGDLAKMADGC